MLTNQARLDAWEASENAKARRTAQTATRFRWVALALGGLGFAAAVYLLLALPGVLS